MKWIKLSDKKPKYGQEAVVVSSENYYGRPEIYAAEWHESLGFFVFSDDTHHSYIEYWLPLTEIPFPTEI